MFLSEAETVGYTDEPQFTSTGQIVPHHNRIRLLSLVGLSFGGRKTDMGAMMLGLFFKQKQEKEVDLLFWIMSLNLKNPFDFFNKKTSSRSQKDY